MAWSGPLNRIDDYRFEIPRSFKPCMSTSAVIFADDKMIQSVKMDNAPEQAANVACLPGIVGKSLAMPDIHWGYGFPIGGVAAFDAEKGVISPGGIGYDINCGVKLVRTNLTFKDVERDVKKLIDAMFENVPSGVGEKGKLRLSIGQMDDVLQDGAKWAVSQGYGWEDDLASCEEGGCMPTADSSKVDGRAKQRGAPQLGTLGGGNHFLEIQKVEKIFDADAAKAFGIDSVDQIMVSIHSGSRGCGHQIASDYIRVMESAIRKYNISVPDRQLACAPIDSDEGRDYIAAMNCGVNYAFANRQAMMHWLREGFSKVLGQSAESLGMDLVYDICHNVAKFEQHAVDGKKKELLVHRKGATRARPAGRKENQGDYSGTGHPALIPGSMGTASYVLVGTELGLQESFASVCHGAGRAMSRTAAMKGKRGEQVKRELEAKGEVIRGASWAGLAEEAPEAYKDIDEVIRSVELAGIGRKVAKMVPLGVMKG